MQGGGLWGGVAGLVSRTGVWTGWGGLEGTRGNSCRALWPQTERLTVQGGMGDVAVGAWGCCVLEQARVASGQGQLHLHLVAGVWPQTSEFTQHRAQAQRE